MLINLTEEQKMIRDMAREFTKNEIEPRDKWMDENGFDFDLYKKVVDAGFMFSHPRKSRCAKNTDIAAQYNHTI